LDDTLAVSHPGYLQYVDIHVCFLQALLRPLGIYLTSVGLGGKD
jgi:hypothetical protein